MQREDWWLIDQKIYSFIDWLMNRLSLSDVLIACVLLQWLLVHPVNKSDLAIWLDFSPNYFSGQWLINWQPILHLLIARWVFLGEFWRQSKSMEEGFLVRWCWCWLNLESRVHLEIVHFGIAWRVLLAEALSIKSMMPVTLLLQPSSTISINLV